MVTIETSSKVVNALGLETSDGGSNALGSPRIKLAMPKPLQRAIPGTILAAGLLWVSVTPSYAKPEYAKTEGKACTFCHATEGKPELNEAGSYYAAHDHSLKGYAPAKQ